MRVAPRFAGAAVAGLALAVAIAAPAFAHVEFEPGEAAPGSVITLELEAANEESGAGLTGIDLRFPEGQPLVVAALPASGDWTAAVQGGEVGGEATGVTWTRPTGPPDEDAVVSLRLGALPTTPGRLQFKLLQTYSNGEVHRWIDEWPEGAEEPEMPGPVLDLVPGAAGDIPPSTTVTSGAPTTSAPTTSTSTTTTSTPAGDDDDDGGSIPVLAIVLGAVVVAGATAMVVVARRGRSTP